MLSAMPKNNSDLDLAEPAELSQTWSPQMAPHVVGQFAARAFDENGFPKPQPFEVVCTRCKQKWASMCTTGQIRSHVVSFATRHLHRDPLEQHPPRRE
jgi:hypothetical protein